MNVQEKVATLESLLARVQKNATAPRSRHREADGGGVVITMPAASPVERAAALEAPRTAVHDVASPGKAARIPAAPAAPEIAVAVAGRPSFGQVQVPTAKPVVDTRAEMSRTLAMGAKPLAAAAAAIASAPAAQPAPATHAIAAKEVPPPFEELPEAPRAAAPTIGAAKTEPAPTGPRKARTLAWAGDMLPEDDEPPVEKPGPRKAQTLAWAGDMLPEDEDEAQPAAKAAPAPAPVIAAPPPSTKQGSRTMAFAPELDDDEPPVAAAKAPEPAKSPTGTPKPPVVVVTPAPAVVRVPAAAAKPADKPAVPKRAEAAFAKTVAIGASFELPGLDGGSAPKPPGLEGGSAPKPPGLEGGSAPKAPQPATAGAASPFDELPIDGDVMDVGEDEATALGRGGDELTVDDDTRVADHDQVAAHLAAKKLELAEDADTRLMTSGSAKHADVFSLPGMDAEAPQLQAPVAVPSPVAKPATTPQTVPAREVTVPSRRFEPLESTTPGTARKPGRPPVAAIAGLGLAAMLLVGAGVFVGLRQGWFGGKTATPDRAEPPLTPTATPTAAPHPTTVDGATAPGVLPKIPSATPAVSGAPAASGAAVPSAMPAASGSATPSAVPAASGIPSAVPAASAIPSAVPAASATPAASSIPAAAPAGEGDGAGLGATRGYLEVTANKPSGVYVNGKYVGATSEKIEVDCGAKFVRLGLPPGTGAAKPPSVDWVSEGKTATIACKGATTISIEVK